MNGNFAKRYTLFYGANLHNGVESNSNLWIHHCLCVYSPTQSPNVESGDAFAFPPIGVDCTFNQLPTANSQLFSESICVAVKAFVSVVEANFWSDG